MVKRALAGEEAGEVVPLVGLGWMAAAAVVTAQQLVSEWLKR